MKKIILAVILIQTQLVVLYGSNKKREIENQENQETQRILNKQIKTQQKLQEKLQEKLHGNKNGINKFSLEIALKKLSKHHSQKEE